MLNQLFKNMRKWLRPIADPITIIKGILGYRQYFLDWKRYSNLPHAERFSAADAYPQIHDRTNNTSFDAHYFYTNGWAMRRILSMSPGIHIDIGSQVMFVNQASAVFPLIFVDYRPISVSIAGLIPLGGSLLDLPFASQSLQSVSCLHVIEHIGLGRYGDPLDPLGSHKALKELVRVIAPGGNLYISMPIGRPRLEFNAHRIHTADMVLDMVPDLTLIEFSGVDDQRVYKENRELWELSEADYACGFFWFQRAK